VLPYAITCPPVEFGHKYNTLIAQMLTLTRHENHGKMRKLYGF
jgi:hypothetical protein